MWVDCIGRGGLVLVTDKAYLFFRSMENCIRTVFNIKLMMSYYGQNLLGFMVTNLSTNAHVIHNWDNVIDEFTLHEELKKHLLKRIIKYWVNIRGNAFVKAWVDQNKKTKKNLSDKGEHSLRKQLNTRGARSSKEH